MRRTVVFGALCVLCANARADVAHDVFDRPLAELAPRGTPVLELYSDKQTKVELATSAPQMAYDNRDWRFVTVVYIDLSGVPGLFHGYAKGKIRAGWTRTIEHIRTLFRMRGDAPPGDLERDVAFVADSDGARREAAGLPRDFGQALAIVRDGEGREVARGVFPRDRARVEEVLRSVARQR